MLATSWGWKRFLITVKKRFYQIYSVVNKHPGMQLWRFDFILRSGVGI